MSTTTKASSTTSRLMMATLRRMFASAISTAFTFIGACAILTVYNAQFLWELLVGLFYTAIPVIAVWILLLYINSRRVPVGQTPIAINRIWDWISHNSLTMAVTIIVIVGISCKFHPEISAEYHKAVYLLFQDIAEFLKQIFPLVLVIIIIIFGFNFMLKGFKSHKK